MNEATIEAITVLRELLKSDAESIRLQAAAALLQFAATTDNASVSDPTKEDASQTSGVVRANRFELVGTDGTVLAVLGKIDKHPLDSSFVGEGIGLALLDSVGRPQVRLCADNHDGVLNSQGLTIFGDSGEYKVNVSANGVGGGIIIENGSLGILQLILVGKSPYLVFKDKDDKERLLFKLDTLQLQAEDGTTLFKVP